MADSVIKWLFSSIFGSEVRFLGFFFGGGGLKASRQILVSHAILFFFTLCFLSLFFLIFFGLCITYGPLVILGSPFLL